MQNITVFDIVEAVGGVLLCGDGNQQIKHLSIDSRSSQGDDLFVPIIGAKVDAHHFIDQAFASGCVATLTSEHEIMDCDQAFIRVGDTISALHKIGELCRSRISVPAIGVTGSVGKTTTREMISYALSAEKRVYKTNKNYNSSVGLPITISEMSNDYDIAVLELGMNVPKELETIAQIAELSAAVITNIGVAHIEYFETKEAICKEKYTITKGLREDGVLFLNGDDPLLMEQKDSTGFPYILYGTGENCDYRAVNIRMVKGRYQFDLLYKGECLPVRLSVLGEHNVGNAACALAVADYLKIDLEKAARSLEGFTGFTGRLQTFSVNGYTLIDDTYNASPASMQAGIHVLESIPAEGRKIAVLSEMLELGSNAVTYHEDVGRYLAAKEIDEVILIGDMAANIGRAAAKEHTMITIKNMENNQEASAYLRKRLLPEDVVYLKASNGMKLKEIVESLQQDKGDC